MFADLFNRLKAVLLRRSVENDLDEELRFDMERRVAKYLNAGAAEQEARRLASLEFGGLDQIKEEVRDSRGVALVDDLQRDMRYAFRTLGRAPGFTATAIISLALGIGGTTAAFTLLDYVLLRPLPFPEPAQLVMVYQTQMAKGYPRLVTSWPNYRDWKAMNHTFESMGVYTTLAANLS